MKQALPNIDFEISDSLVDDGILDSMTITIIISELSMEFGVNIPFEELESKNFNSVDNMAALIERCPKAEWA